MTWPTLSLICFLYIITIITNVDAGGGVGGVNHRYLQFLSAGERDSTIQAAISINSSVIRIFIGGLSEGEILIKGSVILPRSDPEISPGNFDPSLLDAYDDILASVYKFSKGLTKVIISPHDANGLDPEGTGYCDSYCQAVSGNRRAFYTDRSIRSAYKKRLAYFFNEYKSKNFGGANWSNLDQVILGVDIQNEPFVGTTQPYPEDWICDTASYLKDDLGLGRNNILVVSGGISGQNSALGRENWPDAVFTCSAIKVVAIHGSFTNMNDTYTALTAWATLFIPKMPLVASATKYNKLVLVEDWSFKPSTTDVLTKPDDIWRIGEVFTFRGISALYGPIASGPVNASCITCAPEDITLLDKTDASRRSLEIGLRNGFGFNGQNSKVFSWASYIPTIYTTVNYPLDTMARLYPDRKCGADRCLGNIYSLYHPCASNTVCKNDICTECRAGCEGQPCPCHRSNVCIDGTCVACENANQPNVACLGGSCGGARRCLNLGYCMTGRCLDCGGSDCAANPCIAHADCSVGEVCVANQCKGCTAGSGCVGESCIGAGDCKTGLCSSLGLCEYP